MNVRFKSRAPWALAFSFARAIEQPALEIWQGKEANVLAAQQVQCDNKDPATHEILGIAKNIHVKPNTAQSKAHKSTSGSKSSAKDDPEICSYSEGR
jgi:hypothetical protein